MLKQRVFFFAPGAENSGDMVADDDLRIMAADYLRVYGEGCLADPETPAFVRREIGKLRESGLPQAG